MKVGSVINAGNQTTQNFSLHAGVFEMEVVVTAADGTGESGCVDRRFAAQVGFD